jgi:hypothetical protein
MPSDSPLWLVIAVLVITNLVSLWQVLVANRARKDAVETAEQARLTVEASARRTEFGLRVRWAAEQALSVDQGKQRLGAAILFQLERDEASDTADRAFARTAYRAAVAPRLATWDALIQAGEPVAFGPIGESEEDQA